MATYLITGANRGIGYEFCRQLQANGETVIAVCRSASDSLKALGIRIIEGIDITSEVSVEALVDQLSGQTMKSMPSVHCG
jgi:NAD(P)-dependent dehydrogenase (short-subunit alcohol dehydrogenase family)